MTNQGLVRPTGLTQSLSVRRVFVLRRVMEREDKGLEFCGTLNARRLLHAAVHVAILCSGGGDCFRDIFRRQAAGQNPSLGKMSFAVAFKFRPIASGTGATHFIRVE